MKQSLSKLLGLIALLSITVSAGLGQSTQAREPQPSTSMYPVINLASETNADTPKSSKPKASHRLIVELESPALAAWAKGQTGLYKSNGRLDVKSAAAQNYINRLKAEQNTFIASMQKTLPGSKVSTFINELNQAEQNRYQVVFNGMAVETGNLTQEEAIKSLKSMPGVKSVSLDYAHSMDLHASNDLIGSPAVWTSLGGRDNAGAGIKLASMDGGVHNEGPMFSGEGYDWPSDIPAPGLGDTANNNGKIIVSRKYFRPWDMPSAGDENPWPGTLGTSHGVHTAGIAAGNVVTATYLGLDIPNMSGVAPRAWLMSYRVFYNSVTNDGSFYNAEGIAALEDILMDNADVLNNSWGGGPSSAGGEYDALDTALVNVAEGGTFVSMSAGNAGPGYGTTDHPGDAYINVAATTTDRVYASGKFFVTQPNTGTIPPVLQDMPYGTTSGFGAQLPLGQNLDYHLVLPPNTPEGCNVSGVNPWPAGTFTGQNVNVLILRGGCEFAEKILNAQEAGAQFVVIYNQPANANNIINMGAGVDSPGVTISAILIGNTPGEELKNWITAHPSTNVARVSTVAYTVTQDADVMAGFSSRGPGVGDVLKPDIAAPGVNIMSQGYTAGVTGEDRHLGYGQVSGTSMAAPHVAGAAALLRQMHPTWTNGDIKSALMTTAKYLEVYDFDGSPAQPLDMGAGRLDIDAATDPGVIVNPPSLSFSKVVTGTTKSIAVTVRNITNATETYAISTLYTGDGFDQTTTLPGYSVSPASLTLAPGETKSFVVTFDAAQGQGYGDNQGYIVLDGSTHEAHLAAWARVTYAAPVADVLVIDNDASTTLGAADYASYYTDALDELGYTYDVWDADAEFGNLNTIPDATTLMSYKAVVYFTGDNYQPDGTFTVATPLTVLDQDELTQYANSGGTVIAMGQDLSAVLASDAEDDGSFFYSFILGANWWADSITEEETPTLDILDSSFAAPEFAEVVIDLSGTGDGAHNQFFNDELNYITKDPTDDDNLVSNVPFLRYPYSNDPTEGTVGMLHRDQPTLERPGITYWGRSAYTTFGLEGVNNNANKTSRAELLGSLLEWAWDDVTAVVTATASAPNPEVMYTFEAAITSEFGEGYTYRWDFGDGSAYTAPSQSATTTHSYPVMANGMTYVVRLEATDSYGNKTVVPTTITVGDFRLFTPAVRK